MRRETAAVPTIAILPMDSPIVAVRQVRKKFHLDSLFVIYLIQPMDSPFVVVLRVSIDFILNKHFFKKEK